MSVVNYHHYKDTANPTSRAKLIEKFGDDWVYVGRRNDSYGFAHSALANPFVSDPRAKGILVSDPIGEFKVHLWAKIKANDPVVMAVLSRIGPSTGIVCWCDPRPCHARIVERAAAWLRAQVATPVVPVVETPHAAANLDLPTLALSIQQPWAWAIIRPDITDPVERAAAYAAGIIKDIENRTWPTNVRGRVLVHTGKKIDQDAYPYLAREFPWLKVPRPEELPTFGVVGVVEITDCVRQSRSHWFGGDYGFVLAEALPLPYKAMPGKLKFFHCEYA